MEKSWQEKFDRVWRFPEQTAKSWKERTGKKVLGWTLPDAPEELIYASGILPMAILARGIDFSRADAHFQGFACSYSRSLLELIERGELDFLDGLLIAHTCDTMRAFDLVVKEMERFELCESYRLPRIYANPASRRYFRQELERIRSRLSELSGHYPDAEEIRSALRVFQQLKSALKNLKSELKKGKISARLFFSALRAGMVGDKEEVRQMIEQCREELKNKEPEPEKKFKVILAGKVAEPFEIIEEIERAGFWVVDDLLALGSRWLSAVADPEQEPVDALIQAQENKLPFAGLTHQKSSRAEWLIERVKENQAQGVIYLLQRFCEPYELEVVGVEQELKNAEIPFLRLETTYQPSSLPALRTRLDAFYEMLSE